MRAIICGPRDWEDVWLVERAVLLAIAHDGTEDTTIIHGGARGADSIAAKVAEAWGVATEAYPADWGTHGKAAGHIRNQQMLDTGVDLVIAMSPRTGLTRGTGDMVRRARRECAPTIVMVS